MRRAARIFIEAIIIGSFVIVVIQLLARCS